MNTIFYYPPKATPSECETHGLGVLHCERATIFEEINGEYTCEVETYTEIVSEQIIKLNGELFRLSKPDREMTPSGHLKYKATGWHISYDLADDMILDRRFPNWSGAAVSQIVQAGSDKRFTGTSDIADKATLNIIRLSPLAALIGEQDNSYINRWGGEIYRHGWNVDMLKRRGKESGQTIQFKKNLLGLNIEENADRIVNRLVPTFLSAPNVASLLPEKYINSPHIKDTAVPHVDTIHFGDIEVGRVQDGSVQYPTNESAYIEVRKRVSELYESGIDRPHINAKVRFIELSDTEEYKDLKKLERLNLGDTVQIVYKNWTFYQRVISYELDAITGRYNWIELGDKTPTITHEVSSIGTQAALGAKDAIIGEVTPQIKAQENLNNLIAESMGYKSESRRGNDGKLITYYFDGATLETSKYIAIRPDPATFAWTISGWNNGSPVWKYGRSRDGNAILNALTLNKLNANHIQAHSIDTNQLAAGAVTADKIAARAITAAKIASGTITANEIAGRTITAAEIASGTITADKIAGRTITAAEIASGAITADKIAAGAVTADMMTTGRISARYGVSYFDLDTGYIKANRGEFSGTITASNIRNTSFSASGYNGSYNFDSAGSNRTQKMSAQTFDFQSGYIRSGVHIGSAIYVSSTGIRMAVGRNTAVFERVGSAWLGIYAGNPDSAANLLWAVGNNGTVYTGSDLQLKKDVRKINYKEALDFVRSFDLFDFKYRNTDEEKVGVVANFFKYIPSRFSDLIIKNIHDGILGVDYQQLTTLGLGALKELDKNIGELSERVSQLEKGKPWKTKLNKMLGKML